MKHCKSIVALKDQVIGWHQQYKTIAFVPTMGNLHQGHLSLVQKAQELADRVIVSIFVNPSQFDDALDLLSYPRTLEADIIQLNKINCDLVFTPEVAVMYPLGMEGHSTVLVPGMDDELCGNSRPGHFKGVSMMVSKLFNVVQADIAIFGEKDYQQLLIIKKMVSDLNLPIEVIGCRTFRDNTGLAMSSRNRYFTDYELKNAHILYLTLIELKDYLEQGNQNFKRLQQQAIEKLKLAGFRPEYVEIRRIDNLYPVSSIDDVNLIIMAAGHLGKVRLIDNVICDLA